MTSPSRKKPPITAPETPADAELGSQQRSSTLARTGIAWTFGIVVVLALVASVDADKPAAIAPSPDDDLKIHQRSDQKRLQLGWTQPKSLQDSLDTLKWVKPKQARMAEIHRPRPSFLRASGKASPIKVTVPSAETTGLVRLAAAQVPTPAEEDDVSEVFEDDLNLEDLLSDEGDDDGFRLPNDPGDDDPSGDEPDALERTLEPPADPTESTAPEPTTGDPLPDFGNDEPRALPLPGNGADFPEDRPTPLDDPGAGIQLEPLSDEVAEMFNGRNCPADEKAFLRAWDELRNRPLSSISLDITPSINPTTPLNPADAGDKDQVRDQKISSAPSRVWRDRRGRVLAEGRMTNYSNAEVRVATAAGTKDLSWYALSNDDLCFVSSWWELPSEFSAATDDVVPRDWTLTTFTWTASAISHKPLYFEEVQLERYGHSAGPIKQPVLSGVHFFGNIFFLPYKMGLNPPTECQYALGYYRPGSCAPWLLPAVPLSARGARWQLAAVIGGLAIFP